MLTSSRGNRSPPRRSSLRHPEESRLTTSIVVVNWNTRDLSVSCVEAVRAHTAAPYELILVDNGSNDGSREALAALADDQTRLISLPENVGFAAGSNCGIQAANGESVCLLNSDTRPSRHWLSHLLDLQARTGAGLVGPYTNRAKGSQRRKPILRRIPPPFRSDLFVPFLSFFCVLIPRWTLERVGPIDERFGLGCFEDDDYCRRVREVGLELWISGRSWVWHDSHSTFKANGVDYRQGSELMERNRALFEKKWQRP